MQHAGCFTLEDEGELCSEKRGLNASSKAAIVSNVFPHTDKLSYSLAKNGLQHLRDP